MEPVTVAGVHFKEQNIKGLEDAMKFVRKYRHVLPLKYHAEYHEVKLSKHLIYKKYFYQLKIRAQFDCKISEYGKYKEFHISGYENAESKKITAFYLLKNIIEYKLKAFLGIDKLHQPEALLTPNYPYSYWITGELMVILHSQKNRR